MSDEDLNRMNDEEPNTGDIVDIVKDLKKTMFICAYEIKEKCYTGEDIRG